MARVYVNTYEKYNNGNLAGEWFDLDNLDAELFYEGIKELHVDEDDPEFMFQDFEGFPKEFYSESGLDERLWEYLALDEDDQQKVSAFIDCFGVYCAADLFTAAQDAYVGSYDSDEDFAEGYIEDFAEGYIKDSGMLSSLPDTMKRYFDTEKFARDLMYDYASSDGFYFSTSW